MMTLSTLKKGESALILDFKDLSDSFSRRLYDVGISIGSEVTMLNILNFGQLFYISIFLLFQYLFLYPKTRC